MSRRIIDRIAIAATLILVPLGCTSTEIEDAYDGIDPGSSALIDQASSPFEGADCSTFKNYPPPPAYKQPGAHCSYNPGPNPGCPTGTEAICTIPESGWVGPYNIYKDNCHDAASCGVDAGTCADIDTGILSCTGETSGIGGHTINYSVVPGTGVHAGKFVICLSEPQSADPNAGKCCWVQDTDVPKTAAGQPGNACYNYQCGAQAKPTGGTALPAGKCWPTASDAAPCKPPWNKTARECCRDWAKRWDHALPTMCSQQSYNNQVGFRCDAYAACVEAAGWVPPGGSTGSESGSSGDESSSGTTSWDTTTSSTTTWDVTTSSATGDAWDTTGIDVSTSGTSDGTWTTG